MTSVIAPATVLADSAAEQYTEPEAPPAPPKRDPGRTGETQTRGNGGKTIKNNGSGLNGESTNLGSGGVTGAQVGVRSRQRDRDVHSKDSNRRHHALKTEAEKSGSGNGLETSVSAVALSGFGDGGEGSTPTAMLIIAIVVPLLAGAGYLGWIRRRGEVDTDLQDRLQALRRSR